MNAKKLKELKAILATGSPTDQLIDALLEDDEPTQPVDPYAWVRALPNNTPVEAQVIGGKYWALWYWYEGKLCELRDGLGPACTLDEIADIRWPLPPDGWALAKKEFYTHILMRKSGAVSLIRDPDLFVDNQIAAIIPIPEATDDT